MAVHIGTSGWSYDHWDGVLYPPGTPPRDRLAHYVARFGTVELNASFYRWPRDATFASWRRRLPPGFQLTVKAPRGLTHAKQLYAPEPWLPRMTSAWHELGDRRAVLLRPAAPGARARRRPAGLLPGAAAGVDAGGRGVPAPELARRGVFALLERHGAAYCVMSGADLPCVLRATAPFVYVRLHGPDTGTSTPAPTPTTTCAGGPTGSGSGPADGRDVYAYFNNDGEGHAVRNALRLREFVGA